MAQFGPAVELILKHEGGYTPGLPNDPGGETNFGISKRSYPNEDIKALTRERAIEIYRQDFWRFDAVQDQALANCLLDAAVNQGPGAAQQLLNQAAHAGLREFQAQRLLRYVKTAVANPKESGYLLGWFRRTLDV